MKIDITTLYKLGLTPDRFYLLCCKKKGLEPKLINVLQETRILQTDQFLTMPKEGSEEILLTEKAEEALVKASHMGKTTKEKYQLSKDEHEYVVKYREMFPAGKLPGRPPFRSSVRELIPRFETWFSKYPEYRDWDLILQATALHIHDNEQEPKYMNSSENFIYKMDKFKGEISNLAKLCQVILDGEIKDNSDSDDDSLIYVPGLNR